jgi:hypothetical protein
MLLLLLRQVLRHQLRERRSLDLTTAMAVIGTAGVVGTVASIATVAAIEAWSAEQGIAGDAMGNAEMRCCPLGCGGRIQRLRRALV